MSSAALLAALAAVAASPDKASAELATRLFERVCLPFTSEGDLPGKAKAAGGAPADDAWRARMQLPFEAWRWGETVAVYVNAPARTCNVAVTGVDVGTVTATTEAYFRRRGYSSEVMENPAVQQALNLPPERTPRFVSRVSAEDGVGVSETAVDESAVGPFVVIAVSGLFR